MASDPGEIDLLLLAAGFTPEQLRRRAAAKKVLRCPECSSLLLIGEAGFVCSEGHGRIHETPAGRKVSELMKLFPELVIGHASMSERLKAAKGLLK